MKTITFRRLPQDSVSVVRFVEGVPYYRHRVRFQLADGRRRSWVRWSPGRPWVYEEVGRELAERFGLDGVKPQSCTIEAV